MSDEYALFRLTQTEGQTIIVNPQQIFLLLTSVTVFALCTAGFPARRISANPFFFFFGFSIYCPQKADRISLPRVVAALYAYTFLRHCGPQYPVKFFNCFRSEFSLSCHIVRHCSFHEKKKKRFSKPRLRLQ